MNNCYIFGYGSLINSTSRAITGITGKGLPVRINGVKRSWFATSLENPMASVGIEADPKSSCNGILFPIAQSELSNFDAREIGYDRAPLSLSQIDFLSNDINIVEDVWIYFAKQTKYPSQKQPIVQSYIDVIIEGCLEVGLDFTEEFIKTTTGWEYTWIEDRLFPKYPRPLDNNNTHLQIDLIIQKFIPGLFDHRKPAHTHLN
jgi:hypothetical protein